MIHEAPRLSPLEKIKECARPNSIEFDLGVRKRHPNRWFLHFLPRKEVIQPHLPVRLPCYDFAPVIDLTFGAFFPRVRPATSGATDFHGVTGGVYKARERIHRGMLIRDY